MPHSSTPVLRIFQLFSLLIVSLGLSACQSILTPRIVLWHSWDGDQAQVIDSAVARFSEIFDDAIIVTAYVPADEMVERYVNSASQGLGPDIFIASSDNLQELISARLISPLDVDDINPSLYYTTSLASLTVDDDLYGVPFAMRPLAMYYNRDLVTTPATSLNELVTQAEAGIGVAINTQFSETVWGIQAYGGRLLADDGQVILNRGAFTNWLNWLQSANSNPQIFLSRDTTTLQDLFTEGRVAYYTGSATELTQIRSVMGEEQVGVAPLPSGPNGTSGPLMQVDALMFNSASSQPARQTALNLASFLTNLEQANTFMRELDLVPTNRRVRVDLRTYPAIAGFIAQTRTAVALPHLPQATRLLEQGDEVLLRVLEGVIAPNTAAEELTTTINAEFGLSIAEDTTTCDLTGEMVIWHSLTNTAQEYLNQFTNTLDNRCSQLTLELVYVPSNDIVNAYLEEFLGGDAPDMVMTSTSNLQQLVQAGSVATLERDMMQSYSPISQETVSLNGVAYGIPVALTGNVFYYNTDIVADAPVTTDSLLVEGSPTFSLLRSADGMLWSLTAYNGISVTNDQVIPDLNRLTTWLAWLANVDDVEHITITSNRFLRTTAFEDGETAYYIGNNTELTDLSARLEGALSVSPFPTGTSPFASPLVTSLALFLNPRSDHLSTSREVALVLTANDEQESMAETLRWVPANTIAVENLTADPLLATIAEIMQSGIVINNNPEAVLATISRSIDRIFTADQEPEQVAQMLFDTLSEGQASE